jgi:3'-phosphoadenosine 5'-phosphosulfate sulfotransferase (PAPS reductase)/FAD synthetase
MLEAKTIREIQAEIADIIDEKGLNQLKIMNCIAGLWLYGEELDTLYEKGEEKEIEIVFLKIGILADEISEAVDEIVGSYKTAFNEMMEADEIFDTLDRMCEVTE